MKQKNTKALQQMSLRLLLTVAAVLVIGTQGQCQQPQILFQTKITDGDLFVRRHLTGTQVDDILVWKHAEGREEAITSFSNLQKQSAYWSIEAAMNQDTTLALVSGNVLGALEYWRLDKSASGSWDFTAKAALGSGALVERIEFQNLSTFRMDTGKGKPDEYGVTDEPRGEHPLYKHVLKNGVKLETPGVSIGTENSHRPKSIKKDNADTNPIATNTAQLSSAAEATPFDTKNAPIAALPESIPSFVWAVMIVVALSLLWLVLKRRS